MTPLGDEASTTTGIPFCIVVIGTRAQLIKMAPVLREMETRGMDYRLIFTGQHLVTMQELLDDFDVRTRPKWLGSRREVDTLGKIIPWFLGTLGRLAFAGRRLFASPQGGERLVLVHGDTFSTLLGAIAGRVHRCTVAHVESGLRSFKLMDPFPEELTRVLMFRLCHVAFCPGEWARKNTDKYHVRSVNIGQNTLLDSVRIVLEDRGFEVERTAQPYCVVSVHRFENLHYERRLRWILSIVHEIAEEYRVEFVLHPATKFRLKQVSEYDKLRSASSIVLRDRMGYRNFIHLMHRASFVLTDGGSNQEELSYLGKPTLIVRERSERLEGLGKNAVLLDSRGIRTWRTSLQSLNTSQYEPREPLIYHSISPSRIIVETLFSNDEATGATPKG